MRNYRLDKEEGHQEAIFEWASYQIARLPELELLHHIPNGGRRDKAEAVAFKRRGVKAGVPDLCLPVARGNFHGLYIELKTEKGKPTKTQKLWIEKLIKQGYFAKVCYGWKDAIETLEYYLTQLEKV